MRLCTVCDEELPANSDRRRLYHAGRCTRIQASRAALKFARGKHRGKYLSLAASACDEYSVNLQGWRGMKLETI